MKISFNGTIVQNQTTDYKDKEGQPQLGRQLVVLPEGSNGEVIRIKVPYSGKYPSNGEVYLTNVDMQVWSFVDKNGKPVNKITYKMLESELESKKK